MRDELKVGDVVRLKSSGPKMTITGSFDEAVSKMSYFSCSWFDEYNAFKTDNFPPAALKLVEGNP